MQTVKYIALFVAVFIISLILFAPKLSLYYAVEQELNSRYDIVIDEGALEEELWGVRANDVKVHVKGLRTAKIDTIRFKTFGVWNRLDIVNIGFDPVVEEMIPIKPQSASVTYAIWNPKHVRVDLETDFGDANGTLDLVQRRLVIRFEDTNKTKDLQQWLQRDEKGWYYEYLLR